MWVYVYKFDKHSVIAIVARGQQEGVQYIREVVAKQ
jgi:hypothetical protein